MKKKTIWTIAAVLLVLLMVQGVVGFSENESKQRLRLADTMSTSVSSEYHEDLAEARRVVEPALEQGKIRTDLVKYSWKQEDGGIFNITADGQLSKINYGYQGTEIGDLSFKEGSVMVSYPELKENEEYQMTVAGDKITLVNVDSQKELVLYPLDKIEEDLS